METAVEKIPKWSVDLCVVVLDFAGGRLWDRVTRSSTAHSLFLGMACSPNCGKMTVYVGVDRKECKNKDNCHGEVHIVIIE
jgi:hypothetical protein